MVFVVLDIVGRELFREIEWQLFPAHLYLLRADSLQVLSKEKEKEKERNRDTQTYIYNEMDVRVK